MDGDDNGEDWNDEHYGGELSMMGHVRCGLDCGVRVSQENNDQHPYQMV